LITGNQSFKAYEEAQRFFSPNIANDYNSTLNPDSKGNVGNIEQKDIKVRKDDKFLFYVDEEPSEGTAVNFVPNGKFMFSQLMFQ
jgi:hypothetical protein